MIKFNIRKPKVMIIFQNPHLSNPNPMCPADCFLKESFFMSWSHGLVTVFFFTYRYYKVQVLCKYSSTWGWVRI